MTDVTKSQGGTTVAITVTETEARAAVGVLQEVASEYNRTITYAELKERVAAITRLPSDQLANTWASRVLNRTIRICETDGHPRLTSLVVRASDGGVGDGFKGALHSSGRDRIEDLQQLEVVAAEERLECYRRFCPDLPENAQPNLTREYKAHLSRRNKPEPRERPVCASCGLQLPATDLCDNCD
ncbi:hypothetical protein [Arthrobacter sp. Ld5]|uniref:hypothetical protein n=1 Tax=Arthrobacter sp. Ld5 TaxID=649152 RepID=UPI003EB714B8